MSTAKVDCSVADQTIGVQPGLLCLGLQACYAYLVSGNNRECDLCDDWLWVPARRRPNARLPSSCRWRKQVWAEMQILEY